MKAATYSTYGTADVVSVTDVPRPEIAETEVLVMVYASTVNTADWRFRASAFPRDFWIAGRMMAGLTKPKHPILGGEFAGRVVSVGSKVTRFRMGDEVFGFSMHGAHAEYLAIDEQAAIARKPAGLGYGEAAAVPFGGITALVFLRDYAKLQPGQKVLVAGASGGVGVYAVQLAKHFGAEVTALSSPAKIDLVRSLGADRVIDYTSEDFTADGEIYDLVFDTAGVMHFKEARAVLKPGGIYLPLEFGFAEVFRSMLPFLNSGRKVVVGVNGDKREDLETLAGLLESGEIRPVIDGTYPLDRIADAHRRVEGRHKAGSVVVAITDGTPVAGQSTEPTRLRSAA